MRNRHSFEKHAHTYESGAIIQHECTKRMCEKLGHLRADTVVDLGCGTGAVFRILSKESYRRFIGIDSSASMLEIHAGYLDGKINTRDIEKGADTRVDSRGRVTLVKEDFDRMDFDRYSGAFFVSSCALQWSKDLGRLLSEIARVGSGLGCCIMTDGTLASINAVLQIRSPIRSRDEVSELLHRCFGGEVEMERRILRFGSTNEMLKSLKFQGLLGGGGLDLAQIRKLYNSEVTVLEYEMLYMVQL